MERSTVAKVLIAFIYVALLAVVVGAATGIVFLWRHLSSRWSEDLIADVLRRDETLREQVCQRRTSEIGDVDLESPSETDVPGHADLTRVTATVLVHPPGMPVCRAPVRFDYHQVAVVTPADNRGRTGASMPVVVEVQVGQNAPVHPPMNLPYPIAAP